MKNVLLISFLLYYFICYSQEKKFVNSIQLYYPSYYFFDKTKFHFGFFPENIGILYQRYNIKKRRGFHINFETYYFNTTNWYNVPKPTLGIVVIRSMFLPSIGYGKEVFNNKQISIKIFSEANGRFGKEYFFNGFPYTTQPNYKRRKMVDFGMSVGTDITYTFPFNLITSLSIKQSFYFFRKHKITSIDVGTPFSSFNINFKLGYSF